MAKDTNYFLQSEKYFSGKKELVFSCTLCVRQFQKIFGIKSTFKYFFSNIRKCVIAYYL